jgi:hypothetical protein
MKRFWRRMLPWPAFTTGALYRDNFALSANQCLHGIHIGDGGETYCPEIERLRAALQRIADRETSCVQSDPDACCSWVAKAALSPKREGE